VLDGVGTAKITAVPDAPLQATLQASTSA